MLSENGFAVALAQNTGMRLAGPVDASLSDATLDRFVVTGTPGAANPHFVARTGTALHMPAAWFCRKTATTAAEGWRRRRPYDLHNQMLTH